MRDQLTRYVDLLFAGASDADDVKQEILQNTLDRYDDLVSQGKSPQAAYSLAIAGIGDISELLSNTPEPELSEPVSAPADYRNIEFRHTPMWKKTVRAVAVFLYVLCAIPLLVLSELGLEMIGLCGTIGIAAVATALIVISSGGGKPTHKTQERSETLTPQQEMRKAIKNAVSTAGLVIYFIVSFSTGAWYITWIIFPIMGAVQGIVNACMDLKEVKNHEN